MLVVVAFSGLGLVEPKRRPDKNPRPALFGVAVTESVPLVGVSGSASPAAAVEPVALAFLCPPTPAASNSELVAEPVAAATELAQLEVAPADLGG